MQRLPAQHEVSERTCDEGDRPEQSPQERREKEQAVKPCEFISQPEDPPDFTGGPYLPVFAGDVVLAAVKHFFEVEIFRAVHLAVDIRNDEIACEPGQGDRKREDLAVDREAFPAGEQPLCSGFRRMFGQHRSEGRPALLQRDAAERQSRTEDHRHPGAERRTAPAVQAADQHRARAARENRTGDLEEKQNVFGLLEEPAEEESKNSDEDDRQPQQQDMLFFGERFLAEGHDHILHEDGPPAVHVGVIGREHRRQHQRREQSEQSGRQDVGEKQRHARLADLLPVKRAERFRNRLCAVGILRAVEESKGADRDEKQQGPLHQLPPYSEKTRHFRFMRTFGGGRITRLPLPGAAGQHHQHNAHQEEPDVEIPDSGRVERVEKRLSRILRRMHGQRLENRLPVEPHHHEDHQDQEHDIAEGSLDEVGQHDRKLSAADRERDAERNHEKEQTYVGAEHEGNPGDLEAVGQLAEKHEEFDRNRRENPVVQHAGEPSQHSAEHPEAAAVAHLEKLRHRKAARLPEAVIDPAADRHEQSDRPGKESPPDRGKSRDIVLFKRRDDRNRADAGDAVGDGQQIPARATVGGKKIRRAFDLALADDQCGRQYEQQSSDNSPVEQLHGGGSFPICFSAVPVFRPDDVFVKLFAIGLITGYIVP